jgi:putative acetyltransferase
MELRKLAFKEMEEAARIHRASFDDKLPWLAGLHTKDEDARFFKEHVFKDNEVWGVIRGNEIVGMIAFTTSWIDQLYILPEAQGQGIGSKLLAVAQSNTDYLQLWTFQKNVSASKFYEARGFVVIRQTDGSDNEEKEPDILYAWSKSVAQLTIL